jgi:hypothetical protein
MLDLASVVENRSLLFRGDAFSAHLISLTLGNKG